MTTASRPSADSSADQPHEVVHETGTVTIDLLNDLKLSLIEPHSAATGALIDLHAVMVSHFEIDATTRALVEMRASLMLRSLLIKTRPPFLNQLCVSSDEILVLIAAWLVVRGHRLP